MTADVFRETRERVSALDAARHFGLTFDRSGRALCPFHNDRHPSTSFRDGRFHCWACGASGDSIDFTGRLLGLDALGAVRRLNEDFRLGLPLDRQMTPAERQAAAQEARRRKEIADSHSRFEAWRKDTAIKLARCVYLGNLVEKNFNLPGLSDLCMEALRRREWFEHLGDVLADGTPEAQLEVWQMREEVKRWTGLLLRG